MNLDTLLDDLTPIAPQEIEEVGESDFETLHDSIAQMLKLADRTAKVGYRAGQSTKHVGEQVNALKEFMESELKSKDADLREARSEIGELTDERDRLVQALMETADLTESAAEAAENELGDDAAERFVRLSRHMERVLGRAGLELLASAGHTFDPTYHEAVDRVEVDGHSSETVVEVVRQGYRYRGELVRLARVTVAS